jgi:hypothetical protein
MRLPDPLPLVALPLDNLPFTFDTGLQKAQGARWCVHRSCLAPCRAGLCASPSLPPPKADPDMKLS